MNQELRIINPIKYKGWDDLVLASPNNSIFHTSSWARVLRDSYNYKPSYLAVIQNKSFEFMLPLMTVGNSLTGYRAVSLPFTDYCEPITKDALYSADLIDDVTRATNSYDWKSVELRGGDHLIIDQPCYLELNLLVLEFLYLHLLLIEPQLCRSPHL